MKQETYYIVVNDKGEYLSFNFYRETTKQWDWTKKICRAHMFNHDDVAAEQAYFYNGTVKRVSITIEED